VPTAVPRAHFRARRAADSALSSRRNTDSEDAPPPTLDLRISVTDRCNFRCLDCTPRELFERAYRFLPREETLSFEEIARLLRVLATRGLRKLRLTGGEPLLRPKLTSLVASLATVEGIEDIALNTNGALLALEAKELRGWVRSRHSKPRFPGR
jgi:molybdenum cofactor biosynthesis enzyme MoaA